MAPPPYPNQQGNNGGIPAKRYKGDENLPNRPMPNQVSSPPSFYLNQQQMQALTALQKNRDNLNPQQMQLYNQLMTNFRQMHQHQQQLRLQQQQQMQLQQQQQQQQQITSPNMQLGYQQPMPNNQNGKLSSCAISSLEIFY